MIYIYKSRPEYTIILILKRPRELIHEPIGHLFLVFLDSGVCVFTSCVGQVLLSIVVWGKFRPLCCLTNIDYFSFSFCLPYHLFIGKLLWVIIKLLHLNLESWTAVKQLGFSVRNGAAGQMDIKLSHVILILKKNISEQKNSRPKPKISKTQTEFRRTWGVGVLSILDIFRPTSNTQHVLGTSSSNGLNAKQQQPPGFLDEKNANT